MFTPSADAVRSCRTFGGIEYCLSFLLPCCRPWVVICINKSGDFLLLNATASANASSCRPIPTPNHGATTLDELNTGFTAVPYKTQFIWSRWNETRGWLEYSLLFENNVFLKCVFMNRCTIQQIQRNVMASACKSSILSKFRLQLCRCYITLLETLTVYRPTPCCLSIRLAMLHNFILCVDH